MWEAIAQAEIGDDVYGEDPTVNRLEEMTAERLGKESALFVTSGTQGNLAAVLTHCGRGDEVILGQRSHTYLYEQGGIAALGGITPWPIPNQGDGTMLLDDIRAAIRGDNIHYPRTRAICLENTHNVCNGSPLTPEYTHAVAEIARQHCLKLHLDGARVFNAAAALDVDVKDLVRDVDSVQLCLSKGLCAPVGSLLCGSAGFVAEARRTRKVLGGGMRQAGILAAAGIVALEQMADRIGEDHVRARRLADGLARIPGVVVSPPASNILYFGLSEDVTLTPDEVVARLEARGVRVLGRIGGRFRAVTHYWISDEDVDHAVSAMAEVMT
ncbi:MAG: low-specificity L-threonine aldolase [Anaerolineae bacterium]|nr:low-specificity L-threonine aldolase [Anaerolineae bacterium]